MAFDNSYTAVTGGTLSAAQWNTHVRDNFTAAWPYTTAGDISYATSATTLNRLAGATANAFLQYTSSDNAPEWIESSTDSAYKFLRQNSTGTGFEFVSSGLGIDNHYDNTGHTYNSTTERDMPNSSLSVTVNQTSTVIVHGWVLISTSTGNQQAELIVNIDGTSSSGESLFEGSSRGITPVSIVGYQTGVTAGTKTVKIRERQNFGGNTYTVYRIFYNVLVIPE